MRNLSIFADFRARFSITQFLGLILVLGVLFATSACSLTSTTPGTSPATLDQKQQVFAAQQAYSVVTQAELDFMADARVSASTKASLKQLDAAVYNALTAASTASAANNSAGLAAAMSAFNTAMGDLNAYLAAQKPPTAATTTTSGATQQ